MSGNIGLRDIYPAGLPTETGATPATQTASGQVPINKGLPGKVVAGFIALLVVLRLVWEKAK